MSCDSPLSRVTSIIVRSSGPATSGATNSLRPYACVHVYAEQTTDEQVSEHQRIWFSSSAARSVI